MNTAVLQVEDLRAYFRTRYFGVKREVRAVDGVTFEVRADEIYGLAGESSSGKTTLVKAIAGLVKPPLQLVDGAARFSFLPGVRTLATASPDVVRAVRWSRLSYIMQGSMSVLNPLRRIRSTFDDFARDHIAGSAAEFERAVLSHLGKVRLDSSVLDAYPHELSGGMRQRVTIALATICNPQFVIADEPTTALDVIVQREVLGMIRQLQQEIGSSVLFVTHDLGVHAALTDRLGIMYGGRLVEEAPTAQLLREPRHPYTRHLIASLPRIGTQERRDGLPGGPPNLADPATGCRFHPRCPIAMDVCRTVAPDLRPSGDDHRVACHAEGAGP
ncbi:MAG TPA: ABC transporter ATP-binding protein [Bradyrhizobium sp.]|nr:ABC transporter ATP-binding protein [Bradyrhizobium sp.]